MPSVPTLEEIVYRSAVKTDLKMFLVHVFGELNPLEMFFDATYLDLLCAYAQRCIEGGIKRLIVNVAPRHLKSLLFSCALVAFMMGNDPSAKFICVSYSQVIADSLAREFRRIVESEWFRRLFPNFVPAKVSDAEFTTTMGGSRIATSPGATLMGRGGEFLILDDPVKPEGGTSAEAQETFRDWFNTTLLSRLNDPMFGVLILVQQRLHVNDPSALLLSTGSYTHVCLPAIATKKEQFTFKGAVIHQRAVGEALNPQRMNLAALEARRMEIGTPIFNALWQQQPDMPSGRLIKLKWLKVLRSFPPRSRGAWTWASIDASSGKEDGDFTAVTIGYSQPDGHYVTDVIRQRMDYEDLKELAFQLHLKDTSMRFVVEDASNGTPLLRTLDRERIPWCVAKTPVGKEDRLKKILGEFEAARVHILDRDFTQDFIAELVTFPEGKNDDQVDSLVHAITWARRVLPRWTQLPKEEKDDKYN